MSKVPEYAAARRKGGGAQAEGRREVDSRQETIGADRPSLRRETERPDGDPCEETTSSLGASDPSSVTQEIPLAPTVAERCQVYPAKRGWTRPATSRT